MPFVDAIRPIDDFTGQWAGRKRNLIGSQLGLNSASWGVGKFTPASPLKPHPGHYHGKSWGTISLTPHQRQEHPHPLTPSGSLPHSLASDFWFRLLPSFPPSTPAQFCSISKNKNARENTREGEQAGKLCQGSSGPGLELMHWFPNPPRQQSACSVLNTRSCARLAGDCFWKDT